MSANITIKDGLGNSVVMRTTDDGSGNQIPMVRLTDATGATFSPVMAAVGSAGYVYVTNGTQTLPSMDAAARRGYVQITDGTTSITVKASSTAALATDTALVVRPLSITDGTNTMPTLDAVARAGFMELTDGTTGPVYVTPATTAALAANKALVVALHPTSPATTNADTALTAGTVPSKAFALAGQYLKFDSLPGCTTNQTAALQIDTKGRQIVGLVPLGTPIYATASSAATTSANVSLTIPASTMGYLDGFDIDGLGATAGSNVVVTITGLVGGTLTYAFGVTAGATVPVHQSYRFNPPLQGSTMAQNIGVTLAGFGAGNTGFTNNAYGHYV